MIALDGVGDAGRGAEGDVAEGIGTIGACARAGDGAIPPDAPGQPDPSQLLFLQPIESKRLLSCTTPNGPPFHTPLTGIQAWMSFLSSCFRF